jgi:DNA-binding protein HU-beta
LTSRDKRRNSAQASRKKVVYGRCYGFFRSTDQRHSGGKTLTKAEFVESIAGNFDSKKAAADAVDAVLDGIQSTLKGGGEISFTGFGKFSVAERGPRQGVNPRTGERITIAGGKVPKFSAGAGLKSSVKGG